MIYKDYLKRALDLFVSMTALAVLSPIVLTLIIILSFANKGSPFFVQVRPGKNGKLFRIIKFKTMNDRRDSKGNLLDDALRLTPFGSFVRKTSMDEIPQLINVVLGDMSLIGPRPLLVEYLPLYDSNQMRRHEVRPGITGWAQVNGRNAIDWRRKFQYDLWYVEQLSFALDLKIIFMTLKKVMISEGINSSTSATMEKFTGN
jgi:undecaprenyl phosphate N,N'-diacetylbacillosamine 1-phosphate transferase